MKCHIISRQWKHKAAILSYARLDARLFTRFQVFHSLADSLNRSTTLYLYAGSQRTARDQLR